MGVTGRWTMLAGQLAVFDVVVSALVVVPVHSIPRCSNCVKLALMPGQGIKVDIADFDIHVHSKVKLKDIISTDCSCDTKVRSCLHSTPVTVMEMPMQMEMPIPLPIAIPIPTPMPMPTL